jgi:hypothetical protein
MKLLTQALKKAIPALYSQENNPNPVVICKFFNPSGAGTWYVLEGEQKEDNEFLFFGLVDLQEKEFGYFCLSELEGYRSKLGMRIERDLYFTPEPISKFK